METTETGGRDGSGGDGVAGLVVAAQSGDVVAMDALISVLTPYVGRLCASVAVENAADALQEVLIAVFRGIGQLKEPAALFSWVRTIAVRESVRVAKERRGEVPTDLLEDVPAPVDVELSGEVRDVLLRLRPEHRVVLVLRHVEGLGEQEVARILDIPVGTVRSRLFRARVSFRRTWD